MDSSLYNVIQQLGKPSVCVCGDFMLDTYVSGQVERVSPEGPIPVLNVKEKQHRPGGAGSVATMLQALDAKVSCVGLRGSDYAGKELERHLGMSGCDTEALIISEDRPTTIKTRYMGYVHSAGRGIQQMIRVDEESTESVSSAVQKKVFSHLSEKLPETDLVLIQDMAKGLFSPALLQRIISACRKQKIPIVVDPSIKQDYSAYRGATCMLPNRMEAERWLGKQLQCMEDYADAALALIDRTDLDFAVITLDREGMFFATKDGKQCHVPTTPRSVLDVTGAGDMVAAMLSISLAGNLPVKTVVMLANAAAGSEVSRQGATPLSRDELGAELLSGAPSALSKIMTERETEKAVSQIRNSGRSIAFTNGVFDLLHLGHVELIRFASQQADCLIVGMNSDQSVKAYKGRDRPLTPEKIRAQTLAAMPNVDYVVIFEDPSVHSLIEKIKPDVLIKGGDYTRKQEVVGWEIVEKSGGRVMRAPHIEGYSTSEIINKIRGQKNASGD